MSRPFRVLIVNTRATNHSGIPFITAFLLSMWALSSFVLNFYSEFLPCIKISILRADMCKVPKMVTRFVQKWKCMSMGCPIGRNNHASGQWTTAIPTGRRWKVRERWHLCSTSSYGERDHHLLHWLLLYERGKEQCLCKHEAPGSFMTPSQTSHGASCPYFHSVTPWVRAEAGASWEMCMLIDREVEFHLDRADFQFCRTI